MLEYRVAGLLAGGKFGEFGKWTQFRQTKTIQTSHAHYIAIGNSPNFFCQIIYQINYAKHSHYMVCGY